MPQQEILIVGTKVKAIVTGEGMRSDGELVGAISEKVEEIVRGAIERAKNNGRNTVRPHDI